MSTDARHRVPAWLRPAIAVLLAAAGATAFPQGFYGVASPPRFELRAMPGESLRQVLEISNAGVLPAKFRIRTADWTLTDENGVVFHDELRPGSCRPWVAIERKELALPGGGRARYRFEVSPPADAPVGECRFALMIEGDEPVVASSDLFNIPVRGRLGVIVYVAIGNAAPKLEVVKAGVEIADGRPKPTVWIRNTGAAHGRVSGFLNGIDARGRELEFAPSNFPILPGETRAIALAAQSGPSEPTEPAFPVTVRGTIEWDGGRAPFEHRFE